MEVFFSHIEIYDRVTPPALPVDIALGATEPTHGTSSHARRVETNQVLLIKAIFCQFSFCH